MVWLYMAGVVVATLLMPGAEVLLALAAWFSLGWCFALWVADIGAQEMPALFGLGVLALFLRALRLRVAARLW